MPSKQPAFSVGKDKSAMTKTRLEHPVLGLKVFDERFLLPDEPRSKHDDQQLGQRRHLHYAASLPEAAASCALDLD